MRKYNADMAKTYIGVTGNGLRVYIDGETSHVITHLKDVPQMLSLIQEILPRITATRLYEKLEFNMDRIIGTTDLVETTGQDTIVYAKRPMRDRYTRFAKNRTASPTSFLSVGLDRDEAGEYKLFTAYLGRRVPPFPVGDGKDSKEWIEFWKTHALVFGTQEIIPGTETSKCPW